MKKPANIRLPLEAVKVYQTGLFELGHYRGAIDGDWGPMTDKAHQAAMFEDDARGGNTPLEGGANWWSGPPRLADRTGVRHNNPLNIKSGAWKGKTGSDSRGHSIFKAPAWGVRAAAINLRSYFNKRGLNTVAKILSRWAPTSDTIGSIPGAPPNSPRDYALFVQKRTGLTPNKRLHLFTGNQVDDPIQLGSLISAMAEYEIGAGFRLHQATIDRGLALV
tara:strand:- start:44587 stop:45246 length:660 start_codon:yes stop_codon:yes gene_type:complete